MTRAFSLRCVLAIVAGFALGTALRTTDPAGYLVALVAVLAYFLVLAYSGDEPP